MKKEKLKNFDKWGERCLCCGCFLAEIDASTEAGWDYAFICNNPKCKSNIVNNAIDSAIDSIMNKKTNNLKESKK